MIRQYLIGHSQQIQSEELRDFSVGLSQVQVLIELAGP